MKSSNQQIDPPRRISSRWPTCATDVNMGLAIGFCVIQNTDSGCKVLFAHSTVLDLVNSPMPIKEDNIADLHHSQPESGKHFCRRLIVTLFYPHLADVPIDLW